MITSFKATFISLIPKFDSPPSFDEYMPISLYDFIYNIIAKVIVKRVKKSTYSKQFGFLEGRKTHNARGGPRGSSLYQN